VLAKAKKLLPLKDAEWKDRDKETCERIKELQPEDFRLVMSVVEKLLRSASQ
jgi:hypothetical protein